MTTTTRSELISVGEPRLYVAFEVGRTTWTLGVTAGFGVAPVVRTVAAGDFVAVDQVLARARRQWGVAPTAPVVSCYEAGRDGFWIHRALVARGIQNQVVDSSSIEVDRRARRAKTDRLDAVKLATMLVRARSGEPRVWRVVHVPTVAAEAARHGSRERAALVAQQTRLRNQIGSWLATWGCAVSRARRRQSQWWTQVRDWAGEALPGEVQVRIARAEAQLTLLAEQLATIDAAQATTVATAAATSALGRLVRLKGVAATSARVLLEEGLVWRQFRNRREVGGLLGYAPTPWASGATVRDQGTRGAGQARLKAIALQLAWNWVRWQPTSALTQWYRAHFGGPRRARRIGIVAVARKLIIALWRYVQTGTVPAGAIITA